MSPRLNDYAWIDSRIDWVPGDKRDKAGVTIREAGAPDLHTICDLFHVKRTVAFKWLNFNGYVVRLAVRNLRYPVGAMVSEHKPSGNRILRYFFSPVYSKTSPFIAKLLIAAALEQPEVPTQIDVDKEDRALQDTVERLGWPLDNLDDDTNTYKSVPWEVDGRGESLEVP